MENYETLTKKTTGDNVDILQFWKANADTFPNLAIFARMFLGIPASSAASERVWSTGGNVVTSQR